MIVIDGSYGEGGGQILRTSLALSMATGKSVRVNSIRAKRSKPGLLRQHLTAVQAAARVSAACVTGDELGSQEITFEPTHLHHGVFEFSIGSAGSASLVLQTLIPALASLDGTSQISVEGGTHNQWAPPFEFMDLSLAPLMKQLGVGCGVELERYGFFPAGGGRLNMSVQGCWSKSALNLLETGPPTRIWARALFNGMPAHIAERELDVCRSQLKLADCQLRRVSSRGPGNALLVVVERPQLVSVFAGFGKRGVRAELIAQQVVSSVQHFLQSDVAVEEYLADQLILPMALAGGGHFTTTEPSTHLLTQLNMVSRFLELEARVTRDGDRWHVHLEH